MDPHKQNCNLNNGSWYRSLQLSAHFQSLVPIARIIYTQFFDLSFCTRLYWVFLKSWRSVSIHIYQMYHDSHLQWSTAHLHPNRTVLFEKPVLKLLIDLLEEEDSEELGAERRVNFSKRVNGWQLSGFFTDTEVHGMLEGKHYEEVSLISRLFGKIVEFCCGNSKSATVTDVFTQYAELIQTIRKPNTRPGWTAQELCDLQRQKKCFKYRTKAVLGAYQASNMQTFKWHMSNHLADALRHLESVAYFDADVCESASNLFKTKHQKSSPKRNSVMDEILSTDQSPKRRKTIALGKKRIWMQNLSSLKSVETGKTVLASSWELCTYPQLLDSK